MMKKLAVVMWIMLVNVGAYAMELAPIQPYSSVAVLPYRYDKNNVPHVLLHYEKTTATCKLYTVSGNSLQRALQYFNTFYTEKLRPNDFAWSMYCKTGAGIFDATRVFFVQLPSGGHFPKSSGYVPLADLKKDLKVGNLPVDATLQQLLQDVEFKHALKMISWGVRLQQTVPDMPEEVRCVSNARDLDPVFEQAYLSGVKKIEIIPWGYGADKKPHAAFLYYADNNMLAPFGDWFSQVQGSWENWLWFRVMQQSDCGVPRASLTNNYISVLLPKERTLVVFVFLRSIAINLVKHPSPYKEFLFLPFRLVSPLFQQRRYLIDGENQINFAPELQKRFHARLIQYVWQLLECMP